MTSALKPYPAYKDSGPAHIQPGLRGFTCRNLFRMRPFYETYADDKKVSPLVTQLQPQAAECLLHAAIERSRKRLENHEITNGTH